MRLKLMDGKVTSNGRAYSLQAREKAAAGALGVMVYPAPVNDQDMNLGNAVGYVIGSELVDGEVWVDINPTTDVGRTLLAEIEVGRAGLFSIGQMDHYEAQEGEVRIVDGSYTLKGIGIEPK